MTCLTSSENDTHEVQPNGSNTEAAEIRSDAPS